jgi:hypothetical protein
MPLSLYYYDIHENRFCLWHRGKLHEFYHEVPESHDLGVLWALAFATFDFLSKTSIIATSTNFMRMELSDNPSRNLRRGACSLMRDRNLRSVPSFGR